MKGSVSLGLGVAAFLGAMACSNGAGNPTGNAGNGGDQNGSGKGERASGIMWVASKSESSLRKPAVTLIDLATGNKTRTVDLPRNPQQMVLTARYGFVLCKGSLLVRIRRSDLAVDSMVIEKKSADGANWFRMAADDDMVWLADVNEGFIHIDPETLKEAGRIRFNNPTGNSVEDIHLVGGAPWVLVGFNSFRLLKIKVEDHTVTETLPLGEDPANPDGPRVAGRRGFGVMGVSGTQALIYEYEKQKFLRVDLAASKVDAFWKADWIRWSSLGTGKDMRIHGYDQGFLVTASDAHWVRRLGRSGTDHREMDLRWYLTSSGVRKDGLFGAGYFSSDQIGQVGLVRAATMDTARSVLWAVEKVDIEFE